MASTVARRVLFELRRYRLHPERAKAYMSNINYWGGTRKRLLPLRLFALPETGGQLHVAHHMYQYESLEERRAARAAALADPDWINFLANSSQHCQTMRSDIYVEATEALHECGLQSGAEFDTKSVGKPGVYELRRYQLRLGYDAVPKFLEFYAEALPSKLKADPEAQLATLLYSDVGALNEVLEIWRHDDVTAMLRSRESARKATEWKKGIASIAGIAQSFQTTLLTPQSVSVWQ